MVGRHQLCSLVCARHTPACCGGVTVFPLFFVLFRKQVTTNPLDPLKHTFYYFRQGDVIHEDTPEQVGPLTFFLLLCSCSSAELLR